MAGVTTATIISNNDFLLPILPSITGRNSNIQPSTAATSLLSVRFDGGYQVIIRPNRIIRGVVKLKVIKPILVSQIRIKFRAEEVATAKVKEEGLESKMERIDQITTTYFDVDHRVWGMEPTAFSTSIWQEISVGEYEYPFALKFPNVNFPPSTDDPVGFSIHYIWSAYLDGPAFSPGIRSKEYILPYRPMVCAPPDSQWSFNQTFCADKNIQVANVKAIFPKHVYCPDDDLKMELQIDSLVDGLAVSEVKYSLYKCSSGQIQLQKGLARKDQRKKILNGSANITGNTGSLMVPVQFHIPSKHVSPSFQSRHLRGYYEIQFSIDFLQGSPLFSKKNLSFDCSVPIGISNLPHYHLLHIPDLTSIQSYMLSKESPYFFDPMLDEPPHHSDDALWASTLDPINSPPPPNYFSLTDLPSQYNRQERVTFTSRLVKSGMGYDVCGESISICAENKNYIW